MKPTKFNNLAPEDADVMLELSPILGITVAKRLTKGGDWKFYIENAQGEKRILKIIKTEERYKYETGDRKDPVKWRNYHARFKQLINTTNIIATQFVGDGTFREGTMSYELTTWIDGEDLVDALPRLSPAQQYAVGVKVGQTLRELHKLPPPWEGLMPWDESYTKNVQGKLQKYAEKPTKTRGEDLLTKYLSENMGLLKGRQRAFPHGDHNTENTILMPNGEIGLIDFAALGADPWIDFWEFPHNVGENPHYNSGEINGYFDGKPPQEFFPLLAFYVANGYMGWYPQHADTATGWFDDMKNPVPSWYYSFAQATRDDIPEIVDLYRSVIGMPGCTWSEDYPNKDTAEYDINKGWLYALKKQDKIAGVVSIGDFGELGDLKWKPKNPCELARIGVHPEFQKQGIGTLLLQHCFEIAKNQGFDGIRILVAKTNTTALALYEKNGFERCGEVNRFDIDFYCYQIALEE